MNVSPADADLPAQARAGALAALPLAAAVAVYGAVFGVLARGAGMAWGELAAMDALVFAGAAQFVAIGLWSEGGIPVLAIALATAAVNLRYVLITASLRDVLGGRWPLGFLGAHLVTDENWALTMALPPARRSAAFLLAGGAVIYAAWNVGGPVGYALGRGLPDPEAIGLDFAFTAAFLALALGMWRGRRLDAVPWAVTAAAACLAAHVLPANWHVLAGSAAGVATLLLRPAPTIGHD